MPTAPQRNSMLTAASNRVIDASADRVTYVVDLKANDINGPLPLSAVALEGKARNDAEENEI